MAAGATSAQALWLGFRSTVSCADRKRLLVEIHRKAFDKKPIALKNRCPMAVKFVAPEQRPEICVFVRDPKPGWTRICVEEQMASALNLRISTYFLIVTYAAITLPVFLRRRIFSTTAPISGSTKSLCALPTKGELISRDVHP